MTDEEMNRDIAEWCGVPKIISETHCCPHFLDETKGLGLLFKYAVPKLHSWNIYPCIQPVSDDEGIEGIEAEVWLGDKGAEGFSSSPTRALAMAIWKVIKEE